MNQRDNDDTRYLGASGDGGGGQRPRQYFPGENDPNYQPQYQQGYSSYESYEPYESYDSYDSGRGASSSSSGSGAALVLGILLFLALLAATVLFFMWRATVDQANQPSPDPVTETIVTTAPPVTETTTVTETTEVTPSNANDGGAGDSGNGLPTSELPGGEGVENFLDDLFNG